MNWQSGFFRAGLLAYVAWLGVIAWQAYFDVTIPNRIADASAARDRSTIENCLRGRTDFGAYSECSAITVPVPGEEAADQAESSEGSSLPTYWPYLGMAVAPWVAMFALWGGFNFVRNGFQPLTKP